MSTPDPYAYDLPWSTLALADLLAVGLLGLALFVLAPAAVAAQVAAERRAGTLDQLRTTPLDPLALLIGLGVGAPARIYLLCAGPMALHVTAGLTGALSFDAMVSSVVVFLVGGAACVLLGAVVALAPLKDTGGGFVALGVAALLGISGLIAIGFASEPYAVQWAFLHPAGAVQAALLTHDGLWRHLVLSPYQLDRFNQSEYLRPLWMTPLAQVVLSLAATLLLGRAACRKLRAPHLPLFSKPQAIALFALTASAAILPIRENDASVDHTAWVPLFLGLLLLPFATALATFATPSFEAWALGLRRRASPLGDDAAPHLTMWAMIAVFLGLLTVRLHEMGFPQLLDHRGLLSLAWGLFTAATVPIYLLFAATRYQTTATRATFGIALVAHFLFQAIGVGISTDHYISDRERITLELAGLLAVVVPAWVLLRQHAVRRRVLSR